jgi:drug/metabolite transporter (DMT)-like permease
MMETLLTKTPSTMPQKSGLRKMSYLLITVGIVLLAVAFFVGLADNPPGILSMLIGGFAVILGAVFLAKKSGTRTIAQQLLYWAPRVLCIVTAMFISMFALDVFSEGQGFWGTTLALLIHLIPTFIILVLLLVSWRREWIGGILFILLGILYVVWAWNKPFGHWSTFVIIAGPLVLTGVLFLLNWRYRGKLRGHS